MIKVPDPQEIVEKIQKAQSDNKLSLNDIISLMKEKYNYSLGQATISRLLSGATDADSFNYLHTLLPLYNALVIDEESDESKKIENMQIMLDYKKICIDALLSQLAEKDQQHKEEINQLKNKYHEKMEKETIKFQEIMDFKSQQIELKDERLTKMIDINERLTEHILNCPRKGSC